MVDVRLITPEDAPAWYRSVWAGFLGSPSEDDVENWLPRLPLGRARGAYEGDTVVGTLASYPMDVSVPGGRLVPMSGLTMVTMRPTHRRRGLVRAMLVEDLAASRERGEAASGLIASEYPIYGRFGYGPAAEHTWLTVDVRAAAMRPDAPGADHGVGMVPSEDLRTVAPALFEAVRRGRPGGVSRTAWWWDTELGIADPVPQHRPTRFAAICRDPRGEPVGYVRYDATETWVARRPANELHVREMVAATPAAEARLWRHLLSTDLVVTVTAQDRRTDELLPWLLTDARAVGEAWRRDMLWLRPLDVRALLEARRYAVPGSLVLQVQDPMGICGGRFRLDVGPDGGECTSTRSDADVVLTAGALGAAYLGGASLRLLRDAGWASERTMGAVAVADALFAWPGAPWCTTWF